MAQPDEPDEAQSERAEQYARQAAALIANGPSDLDRATGHLGMANHELSRAVARPAARWLLGVSNSQDHQDLAAAAGRAREHIELAGKLLAQVPAEAKQRRQAAQLTAWAEVLTPFAALYANAVGVDDSARRATWSDLALDLAENRESDNAELASAALMWQAFAWLRAGKDERALISLPVAWHKPRIMPWDMMSRLLRCRILADTGQYPAATIMLTRIQGTVDAWLKGQSERTVAKWRRLTAAMQYLMMQRWQQDLRETQSKPAEIQKLDDMLAELHEREFKSDSQPIYLPREAIPVLVILPGPAKAATTPSAAVPASRALCFCFLSASLP